MMTTTFTEILEAKRATLGPKPEKVSVYHALKGGKVTTFTNRNDAYNHSKIVEVETNAEQIRLYEYQESIVFSDAYDEFKGLMFAEYNEFTLKFLEKMWDKAFELADDLNHSPKWDEVGDMFETLMDLIVEGAESKK